MELTRADVIKIMARINLHFGGAYKGLTKEEKLTLVEDWYRTLSEYPKEIVEKATDKAIAHSEFAPKLATVVGYIEAMEDTVNQTAEELWARLRSDIYEVSCLSTAIRYDYGEKAEAARMKVRQIFDKLPEELKSYVGGSAETLYAMANKDDDFYDFEKGRFIRAYPSLKARERTKAEMSPELQKLVAGGEFLSIEGRETTNDKNRGTLTE